MTENKQDKIFNPNGVGLRNGNFIGLPFTEENAMVLLLPVSWDLTTSYRPGTSGGPAAIRRESVQLDLYDEFTPEAWKGGIFMLPENESWKKLNERFRPKADSYISFLEEGGDPEQDQAMGEIRNELNNLCRDLHEEVYRSCNAIIASAKIPGVIGGEHSVAWGLLRSLAEKHGDFGILQIDAHMDLRKSYEGFDYSHASIMNNALLLSQVSKLVQVGVRDFCDEEVARTKEEPGRISVYSDSRLSELRFRGERYSDIAATIIDELPQKVYVSFDIDGLEPSLCPGTGTPVPGGLGFAEALYLLRELVKSGRSIIGFDLSETGTGSWDGNVAARVAYQLSLLSIHSRMSVSS